MGKKEILKVAVMTALLSAMVLLTFYFHGVLRTGKVFTHFFYVPIALASLWWGKKGIYAALFLSMVLTFSHLYIRGYSVTGADYVRAFMFLVIGTIIAVLSEALSTEKTAKEHFAGESVRDALTGLRNYAFFEKTADALFDISRKSKSPFSLVIIDIDNFKNVNDVYGHKTGDLILKNFGSAAKKAFRGSDIVIRYGGDEFLVLLPGVGKEGLGKMIDRVKECMREDRVYRDGKVIEYAFSWGAAEYDGAYDSIEGMFAQADKELYAAKKRY